LNFLEAQLTSIELVPLALAPQYANLNINIVEIFKKNLDRAGVIETLVIHPFVLRQQLRRLLKGQRGL
jgi:hypothetical protein